MYMQNLSYALQDLILVETVVKHALELLQLLCMNNPSIQQHLYTHLDTLMHVTYAPRTLADTLKMVSAIE